MRKIWEREVSALAQNKPLKQWTRPERLMKAYSYQGAQQSPNQTQPQR